MGKIWMPGGGGGADLDIITAGASDVLAGKVIVDKDGEPLIGTMPNRGAVSQSLGINGTYTIPAGYHNGAGKVTQNIATMGGQTINPTASQQTVSSSGRYMTGNVVVNAVANLSAGNIKKGAVVGGVTGTFEGYVPGSTDLYYRGNNIAGWARINSEAISFDAGQISVKQFSTSINATFNTTGKNYLNVQGYSIDGGSSAFVSVYRSGSILVGKNYIPNTGDYSTSFSLAGHQANALFEIDFFYRRPAVYRIWLS